MISLVAFLVKLPRLAAVFLIHLYQFFLSPMKRALLGPTGGCRFHPTCSEYARQAFITHGFCKGCYLGFTRILRCHPFNAGGHDPVPPPKNLINTNG